MRKYENRCIFTLKKKFRHLLYVKCKNMITSAIVSQVFYDNKGSEAEVGREVLLLDG